MPTLPSAEGILRWSESDKEPRRAAVQRLGADIRVIDVETSSDVISYTRGDQVHVNRIGPDEYTLVQQGRPGMIKFTADEPSEFEKIIWPKGLRSAQRSQTLRSPQKIVRLAAGAILIGVAAWFFWPALTWDPSGSGADASQTESTTTSLARRSVSTTRPPSATFTGRVIEFVPRSTAELGVVIEAENKSSFSDQVECTIQALDGYGHLKGWDILESRTSIRGGATERFLATIVIQDEGAFEIEEVSVRCH